MTNERLNDRLNEEVRFHIEMEMERNIQRGLDPGEARRQAMLKFGGAERWKSATRDEVRPKLLDGVRHDVAVALRSLRAHRGFAITAILTLALGIGSSTAIFSVVNATLLQPLPYANSERLALVWGDMRARNVNDFPFSPATYDEVRRLSTTFEDIGGLTPFFGSIQVEAEPPERVRALGVTPNLLPIFGTRVLYGRAFSDDDARPAPDAAPGAQAAPPLPNIVLLNHGFWQRRFGGDTSVVGRTIDMEGQPGNIVGVLAPGFEVLFPPNTNIEQHPDLLVAMRLNYVTAPRNNVFLRLVGRLKPGVSFAEANEDVARVAAEARRIDAIMNTSDTRYRVEPMQQDLVREVRPAILALMGAVTFVLLIACANVANLLLVRAAQREREFAVRAALGSSAWRLVRQLLAESLVLSVAGAALGVALAFAGTKLLIALAPADLPRVSDVRIDLVVLVFSAAAAIVAAAAFGVAPALRAARPQLADALRSGRTPGLGGSSLLRSGVVIAEVALSFVLLIGGGLMVRSFVELSRVEPGYDPAGVLTFQVGGRGGRTPEEIETFQRVLGERLRALPGVTAASATTPLPLDGVLFNSRWGKEDAVTDASKFQQANIHVVLPGYFDAMGTRVIEGRVFTAADNRADMFAAVIDRKLAEKAFPGEPAVGKRLFVRSRGQQPEWLEVIGVVEHQRHETLAADGREALFVTDGFFGHGVSGTWAVRTACGAGAACDPMSLASAARAVVAELDPRLAVAAMQPYSDIIGRAMTPTRFALVLITIFAGVAALLACVGLYGVLSTAVRQRTAEIGVRLAFGASRSTILGLVIGRGMRLGAIGLTIGLIGAVLLTRAMETMLIGVRPTDPATYAAIVVLFLGLSFVACWLPARRAASLDPTNALRGD